MKERPGLRTGQVGQAAERDRLAFDRMGQLKFVGPEGDGSNEPAVGFSSSVLLVSHDGQSHVGKLGADLMFATGLGPHLKKTHPLSKPQQSIAKSGRLRALFRLIKGRRFSTFSIDDQMMGELSLGFGFPPTYGEVSFLHLPLTKLGADTRRRLGRSAE